MSLQQLHFTNQVGKRAALHLPHDAHPVELNGHFTDTEFVGDLFVHQTTHNGQHHRFFTRRQRVGKVTSLARNGLQRFVACYPIRSHALQQQEGLNLRMASL